MFYLFFSCSPLGQQLAPVLELFSNNIGIHPGVRRSGSDFESLNNDIDSARYDVNNYYSYSQYLKKKN